MSSVMYPDRNGALGVRFSSADRPRIMIVGVGDLSNHVINQLLARPATSRLILAGRDVAKLQHRANLARYAAANCGMIADVEVAEIDLFDLEATAETLARTRPDIIFMGASLQSWRRITELPKPVFEELDEAQLGPWLPMHLTLNYNLMRAVREAGIQPKVVNAAFPDAVNPVLQQVGLAPDVGIGNVSNVIPGLTFAVSMLTGIAAAELRLKLVAQHYFSHFVPRYGHKGKGDYHLTATRLDGTPVPFDHQAAFKLLDGPLKRLGGVAGQLLTAGSASRVIAALAEDSGILAHTPGPRGLPGGYPVRITAGGAELDLPEDMTLERAVGINQRCQAADGIEAISRDGTVTFTVPEMSIMERLLSYSVRHMPLADTAAQAEELAAKFAEFKAAVETGRVWRKAG